MTGYSSAQLLAVALSILCLTSFAWATRSFFRRPSGTPARMKVVLVASAIFGILQIAEIITTPIQWSVLTVCAVAMQSAALLLFWWAVAVMRNSPPNIAFTNRAIERLITIGPYRYVRHPFYASYLSFWLAAVVLLTSALAVVAAVLMLVLYALAIRQEEIDIANSDLREEWRQYSSRTGALAPKIWR